jgi:predicted O-methyltransferase YrrM
MITDIPTWSWSDIHAANQLTNKGRYYTASKKYPNVLGWLLDEEGRLLSKYASNKRVLELGAYCGLSTLWLSEKAISVDTIDTFEAGGVEGLNRYNTLEKFRFNLKDRKNVTHWIGRNEDVIPKMDKVFDFAFIDASHDFKSVVQDYLLVLDKLSNESLVAFHDYSAADMDVVQAVNLIISLGGVKVEQASSLVVINPKQENKGLLQNFLQRVMNEQVK